MANDLVDEFRLFIYPLVLGKGKRLRKIDDARSTANSALPFRRFLKHLV